MKYVGRNHFKLIYFLFLVLASTRLVYGGTLGVLTYEVHAENIEITDCNTTASGSLVIPSVIENLPVTMIKDWAFSSCYDLTNISIPDSVTYIGDFAMGFNGLISITVGEGNTSFASVDGVLFNKNITVLLQYPGGKSGSYTPPASVSSFSEWSFYYCPQLTTISIPTALTFIGDYSFWACYNLVSFTVESGNLHYSSIDGVLFNKNMTSLVRYPSAKAGDYIIPDGITGIFERAFTFCDYLTNITLPASVFSTGSRTFSSCKNLLSITVSEENLYLTSIDGVLFNKDTTRIINYPAGKNGAYTLPENLVTVDDSAFYMCDGLTHITFPENLNTINRYAFYGCTSLSTIIIPENVTTIGFAAFYATSQLGKVVFMGNAPFVDKYAFDYTLEGFSIYYYDSNSGFTSPLWYGYPTITLSFKNTDPIILWLDGYGYPLDTEIGHQDQNGDGVDLLTAYALNLNPLLDLSDSMPKSIIDSGKMSMQFYAAAEGVEYIVKTNPNLTQTSWTLDGIHISDLNSENERTASVDLDSPCRFLRLNFILN